MNIDRRKTLNEWLISLPPVAWLLVLFVVPALVVAAISFKPADPFGGVGAGWTLDTLRSLGNPNYPAIVWRTIWLSLANTALCMLLAVPTGYFIARLSRTWRPRMMLLIIIPFWTSFLIRIFAWKSLLHPDGPIKRFLLALHLVDADTSLLYNSGAILLVMVYTSLPFAILPVYAAAEKFDFRLVEAARDLGATQFRAFWGVFLPGIRRGMLTALLVVLIPSLGSYVIPDIVGGPSSEMIGNKIAQRTFVDRNLPHASALSSILTITVLLPLVVALVLRRNETGRRRKESA